ncbi:Brix-domain-containing protein [Terfezia boudieri ATCC MYA-4762]|uniref:Brix-domain-containing protein n=1 Tax=Terfezia boudieri ATCC MYA-4762 TaxID=1051890 RepID=A0A3N4LP15_9PEZI|nr:Brix-domain-containing protein [Terfezia boudieri ATCC MYA-4762]
MARRRTKKRTHNLHTAKPKTPTGEQPLHAALKDKIPKSMVIRIGAGEVGPSISQLVLDTRKMMEPHTAIRLKERKSNKLRDYTTMSGPLGVTQFLLFSRNPSSGSTTLRIARTPRGPTFHFRVKKYSLCKDIRRSMKRPKTPIGKEYLSPPLLVMNNFTTTPCAPGGRAPPHEALIISMFQSLFPAISAQHTPVSSIRRVMLLNRIPKASAANIPEDERSDSDYLIDLRHYSISTKALGLSKALKRLNAAEKIISNSSPSTTVGAKAKGGKGTVPNLGKLDDISEYMLDPSLAASGYTSESEIDDDAEVEVLSGSTKNPGKRKRTTNTTGGAEKHAVKLTEIGPRMTLELVKIEEGLADGKVLYHSFLEKTRKEEKELEERWRERKKVRDERRKVQEENVKRKKELEVTKGKRGKKEGEREGEKEGGNSDWDEIIDYVNSEDESGSDGAEEESGDEGEWDEMDEMDEEED